MKILITCDDITAVGGGAERVVANLSNAFCENGFEVMVLSIVKDGKNPFYYYDKNVKFVYCKSVFGFKKTKNKFAKIFREIARALITPI